MASADSSGNLPKGIGRTEVELLEVPGLGGLYARGAATSVRLAVAARLGRAGRELPDVVYLARGVRADADRLTAYQHLVGESASDVLPAGFVHVLAFPVATALMVHADFPLPPAGMVHLANAVEQLRPVSLGDVLGVRAYARGLRAHRSGTQIQLVTEVTVGGRPGDPGEPAEPGELGGELAWRGVSTYLAKGTHLPPGIRVSDPPQTPVSGPARDGHRGRSDTPGEQGRFVAPVQTGVWMLDGGLGRRYAAVSGDRNPIHLSALTARALGFPRAIAHGMYSASRALATIGATRSDAFTWTVDFARPVLLPGTVTVRVAADDGAPGLSYACWNARSGKVHFTGTVVPR